MRATFSPVWRVIPILWLALGVCTPYASGQVVTNIQQATLMEPDQKTPELSTEELRKILAEKSATVFDARPFNEYAVSHLPGAVNVSAKPGVAISLYVSDTAEIGRVVQDNKGAPIVLYCNGPFCGKSKRLAEELLTAGYTNVRRYQLGIPVWRALGGITEIEARGMQYVREKDQTAVWIDARDPEEFTANPIPKARNLPLSGVKPGKDVGEVKKAKDDGRLPMDDHNTRIIVLGRDGAQAKAVAEAIAREAFHNVSYFAGPLEGLRTAAVR
ncbi:MAG TPA: rhodanese-like domain-containing protein [Thermoanaerobaculia bacterium]|nr:rhodanese-like domain-containing protein [Thermoanaerobaculia bacterium]